MYTDRQTDRQTDTLLAALFQDKLGQPAPKKVKAFWILVKQEMVRWQWHQLDHTQIICTSLQIDNHASTFSLFYRPDALPAAQSAVSKHCVVVWRGELYVYCVCCH